MDMAKTTQLAMNGMIGINFDGSMSALSQSSDKS